MVEDQKKMDWWYQVETNFRNSLITGDLSIVEKLVEENKDNINYLNEERGSRTILHHIAKFSIMDKEWKPEVYSSMFKLLFKYGASANIYSTWNNLLISDLSLNLNLRVLKLLIAQVDNNKALMDINKKDKKGNTVLHKLANKEDYIHLTLKEINQRLEIIEILANNGADFSIVDKNDNTPLMIVTKASEFFAVKDLVVLKEFLKYSSKAVVNYQNPKDDRKNVLMKAIDKINVLSEMNIVNLFVESGKCDLGLIDAVGNTAADLAEKADYQKLATSLRKIEERDNGLGYWQKGALTRNMQISFV